MDDLTEEQAATMQCGTIVIASILLHNGHVDAFNAVIKIATMDPDAFYEIARSVWPKVRDRFNLTGGLH